MFKVKEVLDKMNSHWSVPKSAVHREAEIPFKLRCSFNNGANEQKLSTLAISLPPEAIEFYKATDGAVLFKDDEYGQWGLKIYCLDELDRATRFYLDKRSRDALEGDLIIGEFIGDSDLLLLRCNPHSSDFGSVMIVSAIEQREEWDTAAIDVESFLLELYSQQGDKYWELMH